MVPWCEYIVFINRFAAIANKRSFRGLTKFLKKALAVVHEKTRMRSSHESRHSRYRWKRWIARVNFCRLPMTRSTQAALVQILLVALAIECWLSISYNQMDTSVFGSNKQNITVKATLQKPGLVVIRKLVLAFHYTKAIWFLWNVLEWFLT